MEQRRKEKEERTTLKQEIVPFLLCVLFFQYKLNRASFSTLCLLLAAKEG